jgi:hypothetical protein
MGREYWLDLFTWKTWKEFMDAGGEVSGFRETMRKSVERIKPGDYLLCYLTGLSRWIGALEVTSEAFIDRKKTVWKDEDFPCRVRVKRLVTLKPETAVPITEMRDKLTIFRDTRSPLRWTGFLRGSPRKWKSSDGEAILSAVRNAQEEPIVRPFDPAKLERRPKAMQTRIGIVTIPESLEDVEGPQETTAHTEIEGILLKLGSDLGLDVWVARGDRGREAGGVKFRNIPRLISEIPRQFDEATTRTIGNIDVLWLTGNTIVAAFEVESTTAIYSGLLRMSDLVAMQPNLKIPLYIVAPDERRSKVILEVNRPTFSRLSPPLKEICRFLPFSVLRQRVEALGSMVRHLKAEFLDEISEVCEPEES